MIKFKCSGCGLTCAAHSLDKSIMCPGCGTRLTEKEVLNDPPPINVFYYTPPESLGKYITPHDRDQNTLLVRQTDTENASPNQALNVKEERPSSAEAAIKQSCAYVNKAGTAEQSLFDKTPAQSGQEGGEADKKAIEKPFAKTPVVSYFIAGVALLFTAGIFLYQFLIAGSEAIVFNRLVGDYDKAIFGGLYLLFHLVSAAVLVIGNTKAGGLFKSGGINPLAAKLYGLFTWIVAILFTWGVIYCVLDILNTFGLIDRII